MLNIGHRPLPAALVFPDPLDDDLADDDCVVLTRRRLVRLALVACETGARFQRDGVRHDPMAWMLAPRRLFGGRTAIDACLELDGCNRAIVLHGLALGLDADAEEIDDLLSDGTGEIVGEIDGPCVRGSQAVTEADIEDGSLMTGSYGGRTPSLKQDGDVLVKCHAA